jgi:hypothetical protein
MELQGLRLRLEVRQSAARRRVELEAPNRAGFNRAVWDLRPDARKAIADTRGSGNEAQAQFVPAGEYTVKMKYGDFKASAKLTAEAGAPLKLGRLCHPERNKGVPSCPRWRTDNLVCPRCGRRRTDSPVCPPLVLGATSLRARALAATATPPCGVQAPGR